MADMKDQEWFIVYQTSSYTGMITKKRYENDPDIIEGFQPHIAWIHPDTPDDVVELLSFRLMPRQGHAILISKD